MKKLIYFLFLFSLPYGVYAQTADTLWMRDLSSVEAFSVCFSPDGSRIATAYSCHGPVMRVFDTQTGDVVYYSETPDMCLYNIKFSSNGRYVAIAEEIGHLTVYDLDSLQMMYNIDTQSGGLYEVDFNADGSKIVAACIDGSIRIFNALSGSLEHTIPNAHTGAVFAIDLSDDDQYIVSGGEDNLVKLWDMNSYSHIRDFTGHTGDVKCVKFTPSGYRILSGDTGDDVIVWNRESGALITTLQEHWADINDIDVSGDETFAVTGANDMTIKVWDLFDYHLIQSLANVEQTRVYGVSISPDQTKIAGAIQTGAVIVWDIHQIVGIEDESSSLQLAVYPNPVTDLLYLQSENPVQELEICDLQGKSQMLIQNPGNVADLTQLPAGVYLAKVKAEKNGHWYSGTFKVIKN